MNKNKILEMFSGKFQYLVNQKIKKDLLEQYLCLYLCSLRETLLEGN